uniref:Transmembrane protein n=1 Tax=Sphenodon punctatus TaxID=8508 RepID=A0A8D0GAY1_SPHPU
MKLFPTLPRSSHGTTELSLPFSSLYSPTAAPFPTTPAGKLPFGTNRPTASQKALLPNLCLTVFSSVWLLSTVSVWGCAVALVVASSAAVVAVVTAAGTSACLGSSLTWASSAFKDGELSVEALVALSVSVAAGAGLSSKEAAGVVACAAGFSEPASAVPSPCFSSAGAPPSLLPSSVFALSDRAASVAAGELLSLFSATPSARASSFFFSAASASAFGTSPFFSTLSFFLVMCPRKLA